MVAVVFGQPPGVVTQASQACKVLVRIVGVAEGVVGWFTPGDWLKVQLSSYDRLGVSRAVYPASSFGQTDLAGH